MLKRLYAWTGSYVYSKYAELVLGILFYIEAIIMLPTDPMLVVYCAKRKDKAMRYAAIATIASALGGLTTYALGYYLWVHAGEQIIHHPFITFFIKPETSKQLCTLYKQNEWTTLLIAGIPPIPFKAATLTAGFCQISLLPFIVCCCIVRGIRFFLMAWITVQYASSLSQFAQRHRWLVAMGAVSGVLIIAWRWYY